MTRLLSRVGAVAVVAVAVLAAASPAVAAEGRASDVQVSREDGVRLVFEATGTEETIDPTSVTLTLNGAEVLAEATPFNANSALVRRTVLVMDTSGSMNVNSRLEGAKEAAKAFVESVPDDVLVGLVTFDRVADVVAAPTSDRAALAEAIDGVTAGGRTAMFDGVLLAAQQLGPTGVRSIVLLSDGNEEGSTTSLSQATKALRDQKISLDAVAFQPTAGGDELVRLADAGRGTVLSSDDSADLLTKFEAAAERISRQLVVTAEVPETVPDGQVRLALSGVVDSETVFASALGLLSAEQTAAPVIANAAPQSTQLANGPWLESWFVWLAVGVFFLGLLGVVAFAANAAIPAKSGGVKKQLSVYTLNRGKVKEERRERTVFGESNVAHTAVDFAGRLTAKRGLEESLQRRLDAGSIPLKPAEWILVQAGVLLVLPVLGFFLSGGNLVITIIAGAIAAAGPFLFLSIKESLRRKKFVNSLPDTLQLMAGSLSAGYSLPQAVDSVVRDGQDPIATEFNRALVEARLGVPIEDALETIADRMRSKDWAWVVMAIRVQREVGGNLAELLLTVAATLRERARIRRQIQTLSAEGRLSAWILGSLPVVFALYLLVARPSYILTLTEEPLGWLMIAGGVITMTVGALWMKKIVNVEV
jgi:tight adherence protein B